VSKVIAQEVIAEHSRQAPLGGSGCQAEGRGIYQVIDKESFGEKIN
jgi:hypothetical protein